MSKLSFRARALDASKPLPVFRCEDLPDLHEYASINRAVPQMPTGMEKEEESEHHLQRAISAQQVYGEKRDNMVIPVPEAESNIAYYESLYPGDFRMPKQLIHIQPFSLDTEQPDYDLDSEDEAFVNKLKKKMDVGALQFEEMIDRLEKGSGQQMLLSKVTCITLKPVSLQEAKLLLKEDDELIKEVFEYWSRKRKACQSGSLIPVVKQEKRDGSSTSDPYVAFRRRTEKMQTRKNRKNDEASYEKMLKLRRDLSRAVTILEMIKRREKSKRELLHLTLEIVEKRNSMADFGGEVMAEVLAQRALEKPVIPLIPITNSNQYRHTEHDRDYKIKMDKPEVVRQKRKYEKKAKPLPLAGSVHSGPAVFNTKDLNQYDFPSSDDEPFSQMFSGSSEVEEENDPDGVFGFRRRTGCQYQAVRSGLVGGWPWSDPAEGGVADVRYRYSLTMLTVPRRCLGLARRRVGRGGRVLLDRAHSEWDNVYHGLDPDSPAFPSLSPTQQPSMDTSHTSTDTSARSSTSPDLTQILLNIKACRWRHFKPRTAPPDDPDNPEHWSARRPRRGFLIRPISTLQKQRGPASYTRPPAPPPAPAFTAEQYQQHQEQLALMQKQQLELVQLQQQAGSTAVTNNPQSLVSKTIDVASAQFAASALLTSDQLMALKSKEDGVGVNGVVSASGVYKGLHHTSSAVSSILPTASPTFTSSPSPAVATTTTNNGTSSANHHVSTAGPAPGQALVGGAVRVSVPSPAGTLSVRQLQRQLTVPASALKLAANANRPIPKVTTGSTTLDMGPSKLRRNRQPGNRQVTDPE
ncbi:enhancer of polycomb homolog 1b isoform X2 [Ctenopharyngodon idella]|uniref:enhancer of polycomb homolog 1b isoform X2 n=1 Tax=Ctenopharyngodon idella TaxID=7959 RepID=UPI002231C59E|nr:enhancer of polycomb homolog 1b isoform X2 [Ctenopharyngodon idella]